MTNENNTHKNKGTKKSKKIIGIIVLEVMVLLILFGAYRLITYMKSDEQDKSDTQGNAAQTSDEDIEEEDLEAELTPEEQEALAEQDRLKQEDKERQDLIAQADLLTLGYDYDGAIDLVKSYQGSEGSYKVYPSMVAAVERFETEKSTLVLYGGTYTSVTQINHIFFHSLVADNSKAFDGDRKEKGYNMYMTTVSEFSKMMQKMYEDGYVLVRMSDIAKKKTLEDGTTKYVEGEFYLREGKKPFVLSVDDVNYYEYMTGDGFASRIVVGDDGIPTCEMILEDGTTTTGQFDVVPILDAFVKEHPDFSYQGAKGLLALTGYEGTLGYRTNDPASPTYEEDKETVKKVAEALKADGWELSSHSWGHKNMQTESFELLKRDTKRWLEEVSPLIGPTNIYIFPYGADIETTMGLYSSDKYKFLKECGFDFYLGVYKEPWMHVKDDYVRMTRRPLDGQALIQFSDRLADLFDSKDIIDPERPSRNW
jgi:peptidoglycan/xylan/chitin deacetylase (PgdA/CDA1 family)